MDPQTALELVKNGATLLLLDAPQNTLVGIDTVMFSVGPAFKGIKMIPPGPHYVYYCSSSREGNEFSPIIGFFINVCPSEVVVRKWNHEEEKFDKLSEEEENSYCQATKNLEFDKYLGPYAFYNYGKWKRLSNYITKSTIERIEPVGGEITAVGESIMVGSVPNSTMQKDLDEQLRNSKFSKPHQKSQIKGCHYTSIPHLIKGKGIPSHERTLLNLDKTALLESILVKNYRGSEDSLLGELQFAFIAFLMGQSLEAFLQWKSVVSLFFSCTEAPFHTRSLLFTKFLKVIYYQLKYGLEKEQSHGESGTSMLDDLWLSSDSFLHHLCKDFFSLVQEASFLDGELLSWARKLERLLQNALGWDFQKHSGVDGLYCQADDEFAPVVVVLDGDA